MVNRDASAVSVVGAQAGTVDDNEGPSLGEWYWVADTVRFGVDQGKEYEWLGCVMRLGLNYIKIESPSGGSSRIHIDEVPKRLRFEPDAADVIKRNIGEYRSQAKELMARVKEITARLGITPAEAIAAPSSQDNANLPAVLTPDMDADAYKTSLVVAKDDLLPDLFKQIKKAHEDMAVWMKAEMLPLQASMVPSKALIENIDTRIFNLSLYAGLTEDIAQCCGGDRAPADERLHVMQRRVYMDEECLLDYAAGGMEFHDIAKFDQWLTKPENRDRILPFPKTIVAMRVRRTRKEREDGDPLAAFISFRLDQADKLTFLYIRNGDRVSRLSCDLDFGELIFPSPGHFDKSKPQMVKMFASDLDTVIDRDLFDDLCREHQATMTKAIQWAEENPDESWIQNPYKNMGDEVNIEGFGRFRPSDWAPLDLSNVKLDEVLKKEAEQVSRYNRIAMIIQGLFDRSDVLAPSRHVNVWDEASFSGSVRLVYDGEHVLYNADPPDWQAYHEACNASLCADSIVTGQMDYWLRAEAAKENRRQQNDWRTKHVYERVKFQPYGDPGPGFVSKMAKWSPKKRQASFRWLRERRDYSVGGTVVARVTVPADNIFNVSAYKSGDYKQFFLDPRTRQEYLKWAPMLLAAEDYIAGKVNVREPAP